MKCTFFLDELMDSLEDEWHVLRGCPEEVQVSGIAIDSRKLEKGDLFVALPSVKGGLCNGGEFISHALNKGAAAVLSEKGILAKYDVSREKTSACFIASSKLRPLLPHLVQRFFPDQPSHLIAVTGTNGKSSVCSFVDQLWAAHNINGATLGTLGLKGAAAAGAVLTTPDVVSLHRILSAESLRGTDYLILEASSHGLEQHRLDGARLEGAAFTSFSQDHLDYHHSMEAYLKAKLLLFERILPPSAFVVLHKALPCYEDVLSVCRRRGHRVITYGRDSTCDLWIENISPRPQGTDVRLKLQGEFSPPTLERTLSFPLVGGFQIENALCAMGIVLAQGLPVEPTFKALLNLTSVRGRLQCIRPSEIRETLHAGADYPAVYVDYAHTPEALSLALQALRPHCAGRLKVVFGCGGDRDAKKRPLMGHIAQTNADEIFVTDDNPRMEDPASIRAMILASCPNGIEIADRRQAIERALLSCNKGDILLIAGKGHETYQIIGENLEDFDDAAVACDILNHFPTS